MNVSRYTKQTNTELRFDVEFITPTFLGGADGNAEIRTAPFKNLLRRWWRIANGNLSPEELWQKESELFGSTEKNPKTEKTFGKSKVMFGILDSNNVRYINEKIDIGKDEYTNLAMYAGYGSANSGKNYIAAVALSPVGRASFFSSGVNGLLCDRVTYLFWCVEILRRKEVRITEKAREKNQSSWWQKSGWRHRSVQGKVM